MKNTFAPINRIPREILSTIPDYLSEEYTADQDLITLTHVCNGWRELFISCPFLWTYLDCKNVEKTRVYIERSKSSLLEVHLREECSPFLYDAFLLTVPYLGRLKSLYLSGSSANLVKIANTYFHSPAPFLEQLYMRYSLPNRYAVEAPFFDGNLPSLRVLRLNGVFTNLPWENLANLTTFDFHNGPDNGISTAQLLDFFECAPLLSNISLFHVSPTASDTSLDQVVPLPSLKRLGITTHPVHSTLLKHLSIPSGASLALHSSFSDEASPIPDHLLKTFENLSSLSHITSIGIWCSRGVGLQFHGPCGGLYVGSNWLGAVTSLPMIQNQALHSLNHFRISATEKLTITEYKNTLSPEIQKSPPYQTLLLMDALHTLVLVECHNIPFVSALDPRKSPSGALVCPKLEELVLHVKKEKWFCINELLEMVKERDSMGARLSTITIISWHEFVPTGKVLELRNHVPHVEYSLRPPSVWDEVFGSDSE